MENIQEKKHLGEKKKWNQVSVHSDLNFSLTKHFQLPIKYFVQSISQERFFVSLISHLAEKHKIKQQWNKSNSSEPFKL